MIIQGDCLTELRKLPSESVNCVMTSPPYWSLRDYGVEGQLGLEPTFHEYINKLCDIFDEVKRVLRKDGTCWVNLGDSYSNSGKGGDSNKMYAKRHTQFGKICDIRRHGKPTRVKELPLKSLCQIPSRFAIEMTNRDWILRNELIWFKPNCLIGSTKLYAKTQKGIIVSILKDLSRLKPQTVQLWDGVKWQNVISWVENKQPLNVLEITLRSGEIIKSTGEHLFVIEDDKIIKAQDLKVGQVLKSTIFPDTKKSVKHIPDDVGYFIGIYLSEGSLGSGKQCIQISSHIKEQKRYKELLKLTSYYDGVCHCYQTSDNGMTINIFSDVLLGISKKYIKGENAKTKHLSNAVWGMNNNFLKNILRGYLEGDGYYDKRNNRWRIGFVKNKLLADDLRVICSRLGYRYKIREYKSKQNGRKYYRGEIRLLTSNHWNNKSVYEIISIKKAKKVGKYWDIVLNKQPHTFTTIGGTIIHNCMPSSVRDRFTVDFEKIFFFVKNKKYLFEQQFEDATSSFGRGVIKAKQKYSDNIGNQAHSGWMGGNPLKGRNKRCVWRITTKPFKESHFAVFPEDLVETPLKAGCPVGGTVLDPFAGSGTVGVVAQRQGKKFIGIELNPEYIKIAERRIANSKELLYGQ